MPGLKIACLKISAASPLLLSQGQVLWFYLQSRSFRNNHQNTGPIFCLPHLSHLPQLPHLPHLLSYLSYPLLFERRLTRTFFLLTNQSRELKFLIQILIACSALCAAQLQDLPDVRHFCSQYLLVRAYSLSRETCPLTQVFIYIWEC